MRYLFIISQLFGGGAERAVSVLTSGLVENGHDVSLILYRQTERDYFVDQRVKIYTLNKNRQGISGKISKMFIFLEIRKIIKKESPNCILPFLDTVLRDTLLATVFIGVPVISTLRNDPKGMRKRTKRIQDISFRFSQAVYMQTEAQKALYPPAIQRKSFVVPNAVDERMIQSGEGRHSDRGIHNLITFGRIVPQKNHRLLVDAVRRVSEEGHHITLKIFGNGPDTASLAQYIKDCGMEQYVLLMGRTDNVIEELKESDLFVFSSNFEGMPNALMEAMAAGLPCISTDCPTGPRELLGDNERGVLVPMNDPDAFAEAILDSIRNPVVANQRGSYAHLYIKEHFVSEKIAQRLHKECTRYVKK